MKRWIGFFALMILVISGMSYWFYLQSRSQSYGVFIGMEREDLLHLKKSYDCLVIDASNLNDDDIEKLGNQSEDLFAYLNVGALEKSNAYYQDFKELVFKAYDNWEDESWIDVTDDSWQDFLIKDLALSLKNKGLDGLFLDNFDVYDQDFRPEVYQSLLALLEGFSDLGLPVIINGGSTFVAELITKNPEKAQILLAGVNQESVFLAYDFNANRASEQKLEDKTFYLDYLKAVSQAEIPVYLIEYGANSKEEIQIKKACRDLGYDLFLAPNIMLDRE